MVRKIRRGGALEVQLARADETRAALLRTARDMFSRSGFYGTTTEALAAEAQVTQGALYHHFKGKKDLFEAVFRDVLDGARQQANANALGASDDLWRRVLVAFESYIALVGSSEDFRQIVLVDGPVVFGWIEWRRLQSEYVATPIVEALTRLMDDGIIVRLPSMALASLLQAALNDAALSIAHAVDPAGARSDMIRTFTSLCEGLRINRDPN